ncbi:MAG: hypothetical protein ACRD0A_01155 [Acidimicrobiales bacterium]
MGALISAITFELFEDAAGLSAATGRAALGLALGAVASYLMAEAVGRDRQMPLTGPLAASAALDVSCESVVIVGSLLIGQGLGPAVITGVFLCGVPEAINWTEKRITRGLPARTILSFWVVLMLLCGAVATLGYGVLRSAPNTTIALVLAFAGGYLLATVTTELIPVANQRSGHVAGLATVMGFGLSFLFIELAH